MAHIKLQSDPAKDQETQKIFEEIKKAAGEVPAPYRAFGNSAHILQANWNKTKRVLSEGNLDFQLKESIALAVSAENGCHFCVHIHRARLEKMGVSVLEIDKIEKSDSKDQSLKTILKFTTQGTKDPAKLNKDDFNNIKNLGYSESDILEILTVMEMFTGYNKIIIALGIQLDD